MGQSLSCQYRNLIEDELCIAVGEGDLQRVRYLLHGNPRLTSSSSSSSSSRKLSLLHHAASQGQIQVLSFLLDLGSNPNSLNPHKQTPLMLACKNGRLPCVERLVESGAHLLVFDSPARRTCLHYAAMNGHTDCLQRILDAGKLPPIAVTWGFSHFVNIRDGTGCTPLHVAARLSHPAVVRLLLSNGAIVSATTTSSSTTTSRNSSPLHLAARGGSPECVRELLAWGADRKQRDGRGHTPYYVAVKFGNAACASLLNPCMAEPLVWPSSWKFMRDLDSEARELLEAALAKANEAREKGIGFNNTTEGEREESNAEDGEEAACSICFENPCTIEVEDCGHKMCAGCTLALCCHNKPNPSMPHSPPPACPFCRQTIVQLKRATAAAVTTPTLNEEKEEASERIPNKVKRLGGECSSGSFKGLGVGKGSFRLLSSLGSGRGVAADKDWLKESSSEELCTAI